MRTGEITRTEFTVADFVSWQRQGTLVLSPVFQRRPVWKPDAKSYFMDTVLRGLPSPIIYIRQRVDLDTKDMYREVVDGQQRLRTLISYVDETLLKDFKASRDRFTINRIHNAEAAGKRFDELPDVSKTRILGYQMSTHILPVNIEDRDVLEMFARLNATGVKLNPQELRNAGYFGVFKTAMYELALEQLERWRRWKVFSDHEIARMQEVEMTSDLMMNMVDGLTGKTQRRLDSIYRQYDEVFAGVAEAKRRFRRVMDSIDELLGSQMTSTVYRSQVYFFSLFVFLYDNIYALGGRFERVKEKRLHPELAGRLRDVSEDFRDRSVPPEVLDAVQRASADLGRRRTRLEYMRARCHA